MPEETAAAVITAEQPVTESTGTRIKTNRERLEEITGTIEQGIRDVFNSENYTEYLRTMSRFHNYSVNNCMLIYMQNPNATRVASYKAWAEKFKRHVYKGEKGIKIIAPAPYSKQYEVEKIDPDTKKPVFGKDGKPVMETKTVTVPAFKPVTVFDVSQTHGRPLPELAHTLTGSVSNFEVMKEAVARTAPVPVNFEPLREGLDGFFDTSKQSITINSSLSQPQTLCAMVHETAHSLLHNPQSDEESKTHSREEIEAESVAYAVCKYFGIETGENSFGYIASWSSDRDTAQLRESLETINSASSALISGIEKNYREITKELGYDTPAEERAADILGIPKDSDKTDEIRGYIENGNITPVIRMLEKAGDDRKEEAGRLINELNEYEKNGFDSAVYLIDGKAYMEIHRTEDGINADFSFYDRNTYKLTDGGFTDFTPEDEAAKYTLYDLAYEISGDFGYAPENLYITDESIRDAIQKANEVKSHESVPDYDDTVPPSPDLTQNDLRAFGYESDVMYPLTRERALQLYDLDCPVYLLFEGNSEAQANVPSEIEMHYGMFGVEKDDWRKIEPRITYLDALADKEKTFYRNTDNCYAIYQIRLNEDNEDIVFMNTAYLKDNNIPVDSTRYDFCYSDSLTPVTDAMTSREIISAKEKDRDPQLDFSRDRVLDEIYDRFNFSKPFDYRARSVSVSDVIALKYNGELSFNYVDSVGFKEIPNFINPERFAPVKDSVSRITVKNEKAEKKEAEKKESVLEKLDKLNEEIKKNSPRKNLRKREKYNGTDI